MKNDDSFIGGLLSGWLQGQLGQLNTKGINPYNPIGTAPEADPEFVDPYLQQGLDAVTFGSDSGQFWGGLLDPGIIKGLVKDGAKSVVSNLRDGVVESRGGPVAPGSKEKHRSQLYRNSGKEADLVNNTLEYTYEMGDAIPEKQILSIEDMVGRPFVTGMADTSTGNMDRLTSVMGTEIPEAFMEGGQDFMFQQRNLDDGRLWESANGAISGFLNQARKAADMAGRDDVLWMPYRMAEGSTDFAHMNGRIAVPYARANMSPADIKRLDERIRSGAGTGELMGVESWPGLLSPDAIEFMDAVGGSRKNIGRAMDEFRDDGALNMSYIRTLLRDPNQHDLIPGNLFNVGQIDLSRGKMPGVHATYGTGMAGTPLGRIKEDVLVGDLLPHWAANRNGFNAENMTPQDFKSLAPGGHGVITDEIVEQILARQRGLLGIGR